MSTLEKKALAFEKLASIHDENSIDQILNFIEKIELNATPKFTEFADKVIEERKEVLEKLTKEDITKFEADSFFKNNAEKYGDVLRKLSH